MPLNFLKLVALKNDGEGHRAQCPACAETGGDHTKSHLKIFKDGRFGCAVHPDDPTHRKRIWALAGDRDTPANTSKTLPGTPVEKPSQTSPQIPPPRPPRPPDSGIDRVNDAISRAFRRAAATKSYPAQVLPTASEMASQPSKKGKEDVWDVFSPTTRVRIENEVEVTSIVIRSEKPVPSATPSDAAKNTAETPAEVPLDEDGNPDWSVPPDAVSNPDFDDVLATWPAWKEANPETDIEPDRKPVARRPNGTMLYEDDVERLKTNKTKDMTVDQWASRFSRKVDNAGARRSDKLKFEQNREPTMTEAEAKEALAAATAYLQHAVAHPAGSSTSKPHPAPQRPPEELLAEWQARIAGWHKRRPRRQPKLF